MDILTILRLAIGTILIFIGLLIIVLAIIGVYRLNYVLNRMHVAATCDTLGMLFILVGLVFLEGITFTTLKLVCIVVFFWLSSPICSHLIAKIESQTNKNIDNECGEIKL
jgi:multicomponent Na+:H+ antiporter subunit G